jgi:hypothetical protein
MYSIQTSWNVSVYQSVAVRDEAWKGWKSHGTGADISNLVGIARQCRPNSAMWGHPPIITFIGLTVSRTDTTRFALVTVGDYGPAIRALHLLMPADIFGPFSITRRYRLCYVHGQPGGMTAYRGY